MTTCARELVMTGLETALTAEMVTAYGAGFVATRNLSVDPLQLLPGQLPRLFLWEGLRTPLKSASDGAPALFTLRVRIIGVVRGRDSAAVQTALNALEAIVDAYIYNPGVINGIPVTINQAGDSGAFAGDTDGTLDYPVTIEYPNVSI